jgi:hypothetical protein
VQGDERGKKGTGEYSFGFRREDGRGGGGGATQGRKSGGEGEGEQRREDRGRAARPHRGCTTNWAVGPNFE